MVPAGRLTAAILALVLALFPVALERCRTACVTTGTAPMQAEPPAHACHDAASSDDRGARLDPQPRDCGHTSEARAYESVSLRAGKTRAIVPMPAVTSFPQHLQANVSSLDTDRPAHRELLPPGLLRLNSPLRV